MVRKRITRFRRKIKKQSDTKTDKLSVGETEKRNLKPGPSSSVYTQHIRGKKNIHQFYVKREKTRREFIKTTSVTPKFIAAKNYVIAEWSVQGYEVFTNIKFTTRGTNHFTLDNDGKIKRVSIFINTPLSPMVKSLDEDRLLVADQGKLALMAWSVV